MKGLAPHTQQIFEAVSKLDCIKPYLLVGGTALSLQIGTRQSEDSYSGHRLKSKNLFAMLTNGNRFTRDARFEQLAPVYAVTAQEIEDYSSFGFRNGYGNSSHFGGFNTNGKMN